MHLAVKGVARCGGYLVTGAASPIGVGNDHQLAFGVDINALAKNAACGVAAVVVGPPLVAIAAPRNVNVGALGGGICPLAVGHDALAVHHRAIEDELAHAGVIA